MSKQLFVDKDGYLRGYIEKHDGIDTPNFDEEYRAIISQKPGKYYVYNVITKTWYYESPEETDTDSEMTHEVTN